MAVSQVKFFVALQLLLENLESFAAIPEHLLDLDDAFL